MFLFFYGENSFLLKRKLKEMEKKYQETAGGDFNLQKFEGSNFNFENFAASAQAVPLLSSSRLIEVSDIFSVKDKSVHEEIKNILNKISPTTVVVFIQEGMPDKRLGLFKALNIKKAAFEFKNLQGGDLNKFIVNEVGEMGGRISSRSVEMLAEYAGDDLWRLSNEINKLVNYTESEITPSDVDEIVSKNVIGNVFHLIESMSSGKKKNALEILDKLIDSSEPPLKIFSVINYQFRVIAQIKAAEGLSNNDYQIAKICSLSPFQVMKNKTFAREISWAKLADTYAKLVNFDTGAKSGKISGEEGLRELIISL